MLLLGLGLAAQKDARWLAFFEWIHYSSWNGRYCFDWVPMLLKSLEVDFLVALHDWILGRPVLLLRVLYPQVP